MKKNIFRRLQTGGNPLIDGRQVTFYWEGEKAPRLIDELHGWEDGAIALKRVPARLVPRAERSLWSVSFELPRDAYLEYAFYDPDTDQRLSDPFNARSVDNGLGGWNNFFYMPRGGPTPLTERQDGIKHGTVTRHMVETAFLVDEGLREVHLYKPPSRRRVPLLIVYDGTDYLERGRLAHIVDNLIAEKRIRPIAMAMLQNGGPYRSLEYACSDATINWLDRVILPLAGEHLNLVDIKRSPGAYGVLGASFGGLMSMYTGLRMPEIFGKVLCQSSVFGLDGRDFAAVDLVRHRQGSDQLDIWMEVGKLDVDKLEPLLDDNRRMQPILKEKGYRVRYREFSGGHNFTAWRDEVWRGLEALFPG